MPSELTTSALQLLASLPKEWGRSRLDDVCLVVDCPHTTPPLTPTGPYVIRSQDMRAGVVKLETAAHVSEATYRERTKRAIPEFGDILYSREGTYFGIAAEVPRDARVCLGQRMVQLRPDKRRVASRFLKYWLNSPLMSQYIAGLRDGSVAERINLSTIRSLPVPLPSMETQDQVSSIIGVLDDRIELLRQTNTTLESIAQALFKSWFIDFDPVRAKQAGREPEGMDAATAALFPAEFEESALGLIPRGWTIRPFAETVHIVGGGTPKTSIPEYWNGEIPWFSVVDAPAVGQVFAVVTDKSVTKLGVDSSSTRVLPKWTTIISARGTVGKLALTGVEMAMNQSCYGLTPRASGGETATYLAAQRLVEDLKRLAHGGVFDTITRDTLNSVLVCDPPPEIIKAFDALTRPLFGRVLANGLQSRSLTETRDTLLPRLISGKLRLPEAQEQLEDALA